MSRLNRKDCEFQETIELHKACIDQLYGFYLDVADTWYVYYPWNMDDLDFLYQFGRGNF